ncbi:tyrosine-type recombinase/integrase [Desulfoferula mesophila]|uniref:Tyr recombinase domain-containing protein n=1 Tax=Desulfoferula mesophila TaxID=3058419 RepID=A0AAU9EHE7_9BACT|nr:hypothetical protein FAK_32360 [Desulfoferula mesophilus]
MPSKRQRNGKKLWVAQINRKDFRKEKIFEDRDQALAWELEVRRLLKIGIPTDSIERLLNAGVPPEEIEAVLSKEGIHSVSLHRWANDYLSSIHVTPKTLREKRDIFRLFFKFFDPVGVTTEIQAGDALDFLNSVFARKGGNEANKARKNLLAAWNWGVEYRDFPVKNPFKAVKKFPHDVEPHYVPLLEDFIKVLDVAEGQDKVILLTFLHTGGRKSEVYNLRWEDVDLDKDEPRIRLKTRKTKDGSLESVWLPMNDELRTALLAHRLTAGKSEWVFTVQEGKYAGQKFINRRTFPKNLCQKAGVTPFGHHGIRGLGATVLAHNNVSMKVAQQFLRHKNLSTTERYLRGIKDIRPHLKVLEGGKKTGTA